MKRVNGKIVAASLLSLGLGSSAYAQDAGAGTNGVTVLEPITVTTPLRRESSLARSTSSVTVITEQEIKQSASSDLIGLLRSYPGVSISASGGMGASSSVSLRGTKSSQTLVLINGVNVKSATLGSASYFNVPLESIERIEIAKGPHSAQYGSDAIGGVINIITKSSGTCVTGNDFCTAVSAGVSYPWGGHVGVDVRGQTQDGTQVSLGGRLIGTQGYNFTTPENPNYEPDRDGFLQGSLNFAISKELGWGAIYADALYARARTEYDDSGYMGNKADNDLFAGKIGVRLDHTDSWSSRIEVFSGADLQKNFRTSTGYKDRYDTVRYGVSASTQKKFEVGETAHTIAVGGELSREQVTSTVAYDVTSRNHSAAYAQYSFEYQGLTIDGGARYDHNNQFGGADTYNIGASYELVPGLVARASYGTGYRAPTFNDLYWPRYGNPNLQPETSRSIEAGLRWQPTDDTVFDVAVYQTRLRNFFNPTAGGGLVNVDAARITGVETSVTHRFNDQWNAGLAFEYREPVDLSTGLDLLRQERVKASFNIGYRPIEELSLSAAVIYGGHRWDSHPATFSRIKMPDYATVDFTAIYAIDKQSDLKFSVENLFDKHYSTAAGYRSPGRTINLSFSRTF